ncbi:MAG TPA: enolase C-terminal domain-like protein, partial [Chthoniobacteraceae bacterium]
PRSVKTFCTIGLSSPEELAEKIEELKGFPLIKIKSDEAADLEPIRTVREATNAQLAVDANCAWGNHDLPPLSGSLHELGAIFLEQPLPPGAELQMPRRDRRLPILADESCVTLDDVSGIQECFDGFNIKLVKCGGITPGLKMARLGRELGLQTMVGCMLESSALIAAGAAVGQSTDYADLDGAWLLGDDPFAGWLFTGGTLTPPSVSGLGVIPSEDLFS